MRKHLLLTGTLIGAIIGYVFLHPFGMVVHQFFHQHVNGTVHLHWDQFIEAYLVAFTVAHLPQSGSYIILGGFMGYLVGRTINAYRIIAENNKRLSVIGKNTAGILHDLNNPLAVMVNSISLLCKEANSEKQSKYCDMLTGQIGRFTRMIGDIRVVAIGNNPINISKTPINTESFLKEIVAKSNFHSDIEINSEVKGEILVDEGHFERIIWNLLKNADEALMDLQPQERYIKVIARKEGNSVIVSVQDNGPGIPIKIVKSLFVLGETYGKSSGSGIGLYNCKKLVEAHGGKIWVDSKSGQGATFYFKIPQ